MTKPFSRSLITLAATALLGGCASVGPDYQTPEPTAPASWDQRPASAANLAAALPMDTRAVPDQWWTVYNDPDLNALQQRLLAHAPDLATGALRLIESRLQRNVTSAQKLPAVNGSAQVGRQASSQNGAETRLADIVGSGDSADAIKEALAQPYTVYQVGFDVQWELDLWGRVRRSVESADAQLDAANARFQGQSLMLTAELARDWFQLQQAQTQLALSQQSVDDAAQILTLLRTQADHGLIAADSADQQQAQLAAMQAQLPPLKAQVAALQNGIAVLLGAEPGSVPQLLDDRSRDLASLLNAPALPDLHLGLPSELARRRPDIHAAEANLHAATANIGVAVADLYPRISLGASGALQSLQASDLGDWDSRSWSIGPVLNLPIFDGGRRRATVKIRELQQQEAAIDYHQTVLTAWQEIDDALNRYASEQARNTHLREQLQSLQRQHAVAQARYQNGLTNANAELQTRLQLQQAASTLAQSDAQLQIALVSVYKAVGGGTT